MTLFFKADVKRDAPLTPKEYIFPKPLYAVVCSVVMRDSSDFASIFETKISITF